MVAEGGPARRFYAEILVVSFAALLLEISYTRVISFKLFYYYTYFVVGLALLGIGAGGVLVTVSERVRRAATETIVVGGLIAGAVTTGLGYLVVAYTPLNTLAIWRYRALGSTKNLALLLVICIGVFASFVPAGVILSTLFGRMPEGIGRLYFADLVGAGLACAVVVTLIASIGPPATIFLAGLLLALATLRLVRRRRPALVAATAALGVLLAIVVVKPSSLPDLTLDATKVQLTSTTYSSWSPIFRVDVIQYKGTRLLFHDGLLGSVMDQWDGKQSSLGSLGFDHDPRRFPFTVLGQAPRRVAIIGAAAGHEALASLYFDAGHVDAVELNPVTYKLVTRTFAGYDGHLAQNPKVHYILGDGRSFMARTHARYDLVWFPAPDSYSATNASTASAFVLSESYLYTTTAIRDALQHLGPNGIVAAQFGEIDFQHKPNRTARYVATARQALRGLGVGDASGHILVATTAADTGSALSTILVKATPFTPDEVGRFVAGLGAAPGTTLAYAPGGGASNAVARSITDAGAALAGFRSSYPYSIGPITDNRPFFWHFVSFGTVMRNFLHPMTVRDFEDSVGERVLLLLLGVALVLAAVFLLLPFVAIRGTWRRLPRKGSSAAYFASLGLGFIFFEVTLIQRLVLFLGYPTYSLTVTLSSMLIFLGSGAYLSGRLQGAPRAPALLLAAVGALTAYYLFGLPATTRAILGWPLAARVPVAFGVVAPLGICLGMWMPLGLRAVARLSDAPREYVAWGWAVNGFASVIGSVLATIVAMGYGFGVVLFLAFLSYAAALATLRRLIAPPA